MRENIGRGFLFCGIALLAATLIRVLANMLQADQFDPWTMVLAAACVFMSIGWGLLKKK